MVIRPLDDRTRYAQSVVADLQPLGFGYVGIGDGRIRCIGDGRGSPLGAPSGERRRRENRGAEGVGSGEGLAPPQPTRGSGGVSLASPAANDFETL